MKNKVRLACGTLHHHIRSSRNSIVSAVLRGQAKQINWRHSWESDRNGRRMLPLQTTSFATMRRGRCTGSLRTISSAIHRIFPFLRPRSHSLPSFGRNKRGGEVGGKAWVLFGSLRQGPLRLSLSCFTPFTVPDLVESCFPGSSDRFSLGDSTLICKVLFPSIYLICLPPTLGDWKVENVAWRIAPFLVLKWNFFCWRTRSFWS